MNNRDEHIVHSLRRWIQGDIDQKEENRLDRQAREDAFLGEALEGYRQFPGSKHQERLERMRKQLPIQKSKGKKRGGPVLFSMPYRVAAAAAVVLAAGLFWWINPAPETSLAEAEPSREVQSAPADEGLAPPVLEDQATGAAETAEGMDAQADTREEEIQTFSNTRKSREAVAAESLAEPAEADRQEASPASPPRENRLPELATMEDNTAERSLDGEQEVVPLNNTPPAPPPGQARELAMDAIKLEAPQGTRLVTGQVLDRSGAPLNGVLVVTPGDQTGTITNSNGQYEILLDSSIQQLAFQRTGFSSQQIDLPDTQNFVRVTLDESAPTMDEVTAAEKVVAKKSKREQVNPAVHASSFNLNIAEPAVSMKRFERHLRRTLEYPQQAIDQNISGSVTLRFTILPNGDVMNVKAISGPSELSREAVRLIESGPKWKIVNGNNKSVTFTYRLDFSL